MAGPSRGPISVEVATTRRPLTGRQKLTALLLTLAIVSVPIAAAAAFLLGRDGGPPPTPDLIAEDDDGRSPNDNRTSVTTPTFEIAGLRPGAVMTIIAARENDTDRRCVIRVAEDGSGTRCTIGLEGAGPIGLGPWTVVAVAGEPDGAGERSLPLSLEIVSAIAADCPTGADLENPVNASEIGDACSFVSGRLLSVRGESRKALVGVPIIAIATRGADLSELTTPLRAVAITGKDGAFTFGLYDGEPVAATCPTNLGETIKPADACGTVSDGAFWSFSVGPIDAEIAGLNALPDAVPLLFRTLDGSIATASVVMQEAKRLEFEIRLAPLPGERTASAITDLPTPLAIGNALSELLPPAERDPFAEALAVAAGLYRDPARLEAAAETTSAPSSPLYIYLLGLAGLLLAFRLYRWSRRVRPHELSLRPLTPAEAASRARESEGSSTRPRA
jgi:hypothetical protein